MSIVIIGGNERMKRQYEEICENFGCTAKVYPKEKGAIKKKIGKPDLLICFTTTVSHKMVNVAKQESKRSKAPTRKRQMPRPLHVETFYLFCTDGRSFHRCSSLLWQGISR